MASGEIKGTTSNQYIQAKIEWSSTTNIANNCSYVTATLSLYKARPSSDKTYGTGTWYISIGGETRSFITYVELYDEQGWVTIGSHTVTVYHASNGSGSTTISASGGIPSTTYTTTTCSGTATLDTIPRASSMTISGSTLGNDVIFTITSAASAFTHSLTYTFGDKGETILSYKPAGSYTWATPVSLANEIPNATSGTITYKLYTWAGTGVSVGVKTYTSTLNIPNTDDFNPPAPAVSIEEAVSGLNAKFGHCVQNKSKLAVKIVATGIYESSIKSYSTTIQGRTYSGNDFTSDTLTASGSSTITVKVTDSRGRSTSASYGLTVLPYTPPKITTLQAWRIDEAGITADDGERMALQLNYTVASVGNRNDCKLKIQCLGGSPSTIITLVDSASAAFSASGTTNYTGTSDPVLSPDYTYTIQVTLADYFTSVSYTVQIPTSQSIMDVLASGDGLGIGKAAETPDLLDVAWNTRLRKDLTVDGAINGYQIEDLDNRLGKLVRRAAGLGSGAIAAGQSVSLTLIGNSLYLVFMWSHAAAAIQSAYLANTYSGTNSKVTAIVQSSSHTVSTSGTTLTMTGTGYPWNYTVCQL